jgi:hypothetical protein
VFLESRLRLPCASVSGFKLDDFFVFGFKRCCKFVRYALENMTSSLNTISYDVVHDFSIIRGKPVGRIKELSDPIAGDREFGRSAAVTPWFQDWPDLLTSYVL